MFCDADIHFQNKHILDDVIHALQVHRVVHPFETALDMGPHGEVLEVHKSFGWCKQQGMKWTIPMADYQKEQETAKKAAQYKGLGNIFHPGFAICFRRDVLENMHGLLEVGILGAGDHHMLTAMIGMANYSMPKGIHANYRAAVMDWQKRAATHIDGDLGYVRGTILHSFHGAKRSRQYKSRWNILIDNNFDPLKDIYRNLQGVVELSPGRPHLRDDIRWYFISRLEDIHVTY